MAIPFWTFQLLLLIPTTVLAQIQCQQGSIGQQPLSRTNAILARGNFLNQVGCVVGSSGGSVTIAPGGGIVVGANGIVASFDQAGDSNTTASCTDLDTAFGALIDACTSFGGSNAVGGNFAVGIESNPVLNSPNQLGPPIQPAGAAITQREVVKHITRTVVLPKAQTTQRPRLNARQNAGFTTTATLVNGATFTIIYTNPTTAANLGGVFAGDAGNLDQALAQVRADLGAMNVFGRPNVGIFAREDIDDPEVGSVEVDLNILQGIGPAPQVRELVADTLAGAVDIFETTPFNFIQFDIFGAGLRSFAAGTLLVPGQAVLRNQPDPLFQDGQFAGWGRHGPILPAPPPF